MQLLLRLLRAAGLTSAIAVSVLSVMLASAGIADVVTMSTTSASWESSPRISAAERPRAADHDTPRIYDGPREMPTSRARVSGAVVAAKGPSGKIALGRNMRERVIPYAERTGAEYYGGTPRGLRWLPERAQVGLNRWWLRRKIKKGYEIDDIGPDPANSRRSPYYDGEHRTLQRHGYPNYRRVGPDGG